MLRTPLIQSMTATLRACLLLMSLLWLAPAQAQLSIEITGAGANRLPIVVPLFERESALPDSVTEVIRADLERSGLFSMVDIGPFALPASSLPDLADMRTRGADAVLTGSVESTGDGRFALSFRLYDTLRQLELGAERYVFTPPQSRAIAHRVADFVYEKLIGLPGYFSSRIAYVVKNGDRFELQIADADGAGMQPALISREPIISPAWSPDGSQLAYVSFEAKKPVVYVHTLSTGQRRVIANFKGSNSAPAWAPDGRSLAVVLTKDGRSQLYLINADGSGLRRIATSSGIDTEPHFSPDGSAIYFTSDRGGNPQIYRIATSGGTAQRITFEGDYNVSPYLSADGKQLLHVTRTQGRFQVAVLDLDNRQRRILTDTARDESPTFSPNDRVILYATENRGRGTLATVSVDGRVRQRLSVQAADVREPAWGPVP